MELHVGHRRLLHGLCWIWIFFAMSGIASSVQAEKALEKEIIIVVAPDRPLRNEFITSLAASLPGSYNTRILSPQDFPASNLDNVGYVVVLGSSSLQVVRDRKIKLPVIASYVAAQLYRSDTIDRVTESAFFPSANWGVQMQLARKLLPNAATVGILISSDFKTYVPELETYAKKNGFKLEVVEWNGKDNLPKVLNRLLRKTDFLLALEDANVFNRNTVKSILLTSYRKNKIVIGPNESYVKAGSLATTWCSTDDVANAVVEAIEYYKVNKQLPESETLSCLSVAINKQVAKSLSISIPADIESGKLIIDEGRK